MLMDEDAARERFDAAVDRLTRAGIGGAMLMSPSAVGAAIGVPEPVLIACLVVAVPLLVAIIVGRPTMMSSLITGIFGCAAVRTHRVPMPPHRREAAQGTSRFVVEWYRNVLVGAFGMLTLLASLQLVDARSNPAAVAYTAVVVLMLGAARARAARVATIDVSDHVVLRGFLRTRRIPLSRIRSVGVARARRRRAAMAGPVPRARRRLDGASRRDPDPAGAVGGRRRRRRRLACPSLARAMTHLRGTYPIGHGRAEVTCRRPWELRSLPHR
jgi:hypothetical protein